MSTKVTVEDLDVPVPPGIEHECLEKDSLLFYIYRNKNINMVLYEAKLDEAGNIIDKDPVGVYWMKVSPDFQAAHRKKGIMSDRLELNLIEKMLAYGISVSKSEKNGEYILKVVSLSSRPMTIKIDPQTGKPAAFGISSTGRHCKIQRIYVNAKEFLFGLPSVQYVLIIATDVETGEEIVEKIKPMG